MRVVVDCCMSEKEYNPYYTFLAVKLCQHSKVCWKCARPVYTEGSSVKIPAVPSQATPTQAVAV